MGLLHQTHTHTEGITPMTKFPNPVRTDQLLANLCMLVIARKQARWQWKHCADEHAHKWTRLVDELDCRINAGEQVVGALLEIPGFRVKREVIE